MTLDEAIYLAAKDERIEQLIQALFHMTESANIAEQQLASEQANVTLLRDALHAVVKAHGYEGGTPVEALSATQDLSGYVLCDAQPVGHGLFDSKGKCHAIGKHRSSMCIGGKAFKSQPLYKAKDKP